MSKKEDIEKLILDSYTIIHKNNQKILVVEPRERARFRQENDENWDYIRTFLAEYTSLCETRRLIPIEDIIDIAATRFPDIAARLEATSNLKNKMLSLHMPFSVSSSINENGALFKIEYHFVQPFLPPDREQLAQFVVRFSSQNGLKSSLPGVGTHVCLILDVSGSMNEASKYPYLLKAIPFVIEALSEKDRLSIILFSSTSELIWSSDVITCRKNLQQILQAIDNSRIKFEGTYLSTALRIAIDKIKEQNLPEEITRLYILTDGQLQDTRACILLNSELRRLGIEINSYGFGQDFAEETMRQIMDGCQGGRVKWVSNTEMIWKSFEHIGEVARNIIAANAKLELTFTPDVTPGDAFRFEPGIFWFGPVDDTSKHFQRHIGGLEKERVYTYAFEARIYPSHNDHEHIATAMLNYTFQGKQQSVKQDIVIERSVEPKKQGQVNKEIEDIFLALEGQRSNDPQSKRVSIEARLKILRHQGGDPAQITLLEKALEELRSEGTLERLSPWERRQLDADTSSTHNSEL